MFVNDKYFWQPKYLFQVTWSDQLYSFSLSLNVIPRSWSKRVKCYTVRFYFWPWVEVQDIITIDPRPVVWLVRKIVKIAKSVKTSNPNIADWLKMLRDTRLERCHVAGLVSSCAILQAKLNCPFIFFYKKKKKDSYK